MLSAEAAKAALAERREQATLTSALGQVTGLAARVAGVITNPHADQSKLPARLGKLGRHGRRIAFGATVPGLGAEAAALYERAGELTYQGSWDRRPFRAPRTPELAGERVLAHLSRSGPELVSHAADAVWLARWSGHLAAQSWMVSSHMVGWLLATAIDAGNDEVFEILLATIDGSDDVATMGRHVPIALLCAEREDGWEAVEQLLLAAQRQEGLRQSILEVVDEAHPRALQRMLGLILEHDLARFSSVARAVSVWLGMEVLAGERRRIESLVRQGLGCLADPVAASAAAGGGEPQDAYVALWATATRDVHEAIEQAEPLLRSAEPQRRFAAARLLSQTGVRAAIPALVGALADEDLRVAAVACDALSRFGPNALPASYDALDALLARLPKRTCTLEAVSWLGPVAPIKREDVASLLFRHVDPPRLDRVLPHVKVLSSWERASVVQCVAKKPGAHREALLAFLSDTSPDVRRNAIAATRALKLSDEEAIALEPLLKRRPGDLRRAVLDLIMDRGETWALDAAGRLLDGNEQQRLAAVELLRRLGDGGEALARLAMLDADDATAVSDASRRAVQDTSLTALTEADGFGLFDAAQLTAGVAPRRTGFTEKTPAALRVIALLDELIEANADVEVLTESWGSSERVLLGAAESLHLGMHLRRLRRGETEIELPLIDLWTAFVENLPADARDPDDQQILRAYLHCAYTTGRFNWDEDAKVAAALGVRRAPLVTDLLGFLVHHRPDERRLACALDGAEDWLAALSRKRLADADTWWSPLALSIVRGLVAEPFADSCVELVRRHWQLERWVSEPPGVKRKHDGYGREDYPGASSRRPLRPPDETVARALALGVATEADLIDHLAGPRDEHWQFSELHRLSAQRERAQLPAADRLAAVVERIAERVVSIELGRGEAPTLASNPVLALRVTGGLDVLVAALQALGKERLVRGWTAYGEDRATVFSHMVASSRPREADTPQRFADATKRAKVSDRRLREVACYTPQWARHVEATLDRPGLADAVWWLHAHTKDDRWEVEDDMRETWSRAVAERTALSSAELIDGAVDVAWFAEVRERLGDAELELLLAAAKYGSSAGGHKRAELFARAMRGDASEDELVARIAKSRHQDSLRAIGLLALPAVQKARDATIARRYALLQEYKRASRQFGRQRQASEGRATEIAMENLARTAGFADPIRLTWAMEAHATADLAGGGVTVEHEGVTVNLGVDPEGRPAVRVHRADKALKAVPAKLRKAPQVKALTDRTTELRRQASRIKQSLEQAMVRGDPLSGAELAGFHDHVLLWPSISRLVLVGDQIAGFPDRAGRVLRDPAGTEHAVGKGEPLRIAHPLDLLERDWPAWQRHVMSERLVQPFKQVFRELYLPVDGERTDDGGSRRYAGHQVQPGRARALLTKRGWSTDDDEARRIDHQENVIASLWFLGGFGSPLDVEAPTLEEVRFHDSRDRRQIDLNDVPRRLFSEIMRDLDLVVSVAHIAGVDPEASQSSLQIRATLVGETCELLGLDNVTIDGPRALVSGEIGRYSVHLGSANVHRLPGGSVCIVPVHSQQRGRVFLPFADDDPKTAELVAKVLMLARDRDIRDPTILEQLRS